MEIVDSEYRYSAIIASKFDLPDLRVNAPYRFYGEKANNIVIYSVDTNEILINPIITHLPEVQKVKKNLEELIESCPILFASGKFFAIDYATNLLVANITTNDIYGYFSNHVPKAETILARDKNNKLVRLSCVGGKTPQLLQYEELAQNFITPVPIEKQTTKLARNIFLDKNDINVSSYFLDSIKESPQRLRPSDFEIKGITSRKEEINNKNHQEETIEMEDGKYSLLDLTQVKAFPTVEKSTEIIIDFVDDSVGIHSGIVNPNNVIILTVDKIPTVNWVLDNFQSDKVYFYTFMKGK
jgi:hypothetical protein